MRCNIWPIHLTSLIKADWFTLSLKAGRIHKTIVLPAVRVPSILHQGVTAAMETGNNLRLPKDDFIFIIEDAAEEIAD